MTLDEKNGFTKLEEIATLKAYLKDTDYVVSKMTERVVLGLPTGDLLNQYQPVLQKRAEARARINALEN